MVAYNFHWCFVPAVETGKKTHTIRGPRARHARVGEPIQLYQGMRTQRCRRIISPDPICSAIRHVALEVVEPHHIPWMIIDGVPVEDLTAFAVADGFRLHDYVTRVPRKWLRDRPAYSIIHGADPAAAMGATWRHMHGLGRWEGVMICWRLAEPTPGA